MSGDGDGDSQRFEGFADEIEQFRDDDRLQHPSIVGQSEAVTDFFERVLDRDDIGPWVLEETAVQAYEACGWLTKTGSRKELQTRADQRGLDVDVEY